MEFNADGWKSRRVVREGLPNLEAGQMLRHGIEIGRGGVWLNLTDEQYHNLGIGMDAKEPDLGRFTETKVDKDKGAFKTPTIRNVALSAPYMHDGSLKTLEQVIDLYDKGGHANPHLDPKIKKLNLSAQDKADLLAFMQACTGDFPKIQRGRLPK